MRELQRYLRPDEFITGIETQGRDINVGAFGYDEDINLVHMTFGGTGGGILNYDLVGADLRTILDVLHNLVYKNTIEKGVPNDESTVINVVESFDDPLSPTYHRVITYKSNNGAPDYAPKITVTNLGTKNFVEAAEEDVEPPVFAVKRFYALYPHDEITPKQMGQYHYEKIAAMLQDPTAKVRALNFLTRIIRWAGDSDFDNEHFYLARGSLSKDDCVNLQNAAYDALDLDKAHVEQFLTKLRKEFDVVKAKPKQLK